MSYARPSRSRALGTLPGSTYPTSTYPTSGGSYFNSGFNSGSLTTFAADASQLLSAIQSIQSLATTFKGVTFSSSSTDDQRQARVDFFKNSALLGSVTAERYILGGIQNTGSHEIPMWTAASNAVQSAVPDVWNEAVNQGAKWAAGIPDPGGTQSMVDDVTRDLKAIGATVPTSSAFPGASSPAPTSPTTAPRPTTPTTHLPPMVTTAPYNWTPLAIGAGAGVLALLLMRKS